MVDDKKPTQGPKPVVDQKHDAPILGADRTHETAKKKLDTGMTVEHAIANAAHWWNSRGRKLIKDKNYATDNPGFGSFTPDPQSAEEADNWIPSGILEGRRWDHLSQKEKLHVTQHWHHNTVRIPNIDPEEYLRAAQRPGVCFYCDEEACADETLPNGEWREMCWAHFMDRYPVEAEKKFFEGTGGPSNDN